MPEEQEREKLAQVIRQWNDNRLDLFEISQPDTSLAFHGVMRFYFEDRVGGNFATKCLRFSSNSSTKEVIETLSEKFRPDMKMLTTCYSLFEIHGNKERKLALDERPLVVQLNWNSDNREGRFVLKKDKERLEEGSNEKEKGSVIQNFKRTLSRKDKKEKKNALADEKASGDKNGSTKKPVNNTSICESDSRTENKTQQQQRQSGTEAVDGPGLPLRVAFNDKSEEAFLSAVINYTNSSTVHFKLSPAYILYAAGRFALGKPHGVTAIANKMVAMTRKVIQRQQSMAGALAFWLANSSELLNFFKNDRDLSRFTQQSQLELSHLVHKAYSCLIQCLQSELRKHLPTFLIDPEQHGSLPAGIEMVLNTLMNTMSLLRRCQVNPALTIQLFSQLFHFISIWLFNHLMIPEADTPGLRSHYWGATLRQRLTGIEAWAERQGLELAADCHLGHIIQATTLLTMNKYSMQDAKDIQNVCFKLNSLQLRTLLAGYLYATTEPHIPPDLIDAVVAGARASADNLIRSEGRDIQLEESLDLHLPFLLPEGGYSCDTVRGIPPGVREFLEPVCQKGLCSLTSQPNPAGDWTVFFTDANSSDRRTLMQAVQREPEIVTVTLKKPLNSGMGVSIVAAKGAGQESLGIYIKSIVKGGPAEMNGRLTAGDQLLSVDGRSLVGLSQERAAAIMMQTGPIVTLQVAKSGASYHGLGALLSEPTPVTASADETYETPNPKGILLYTVAQTNSGHSEAPRGRTGRKNEQMMQRNRQFYRSNPNMTTDFALEDENEPVDPDVRRNITAVSTVNLCTDTFHREYLTLPNPKSQDKNSSESRRSAQMFKVFLRPLEGQSGIRRSFMRQALSQENLCVDDGGPLLDKRQTAQQDERAKQTSGNYSHFPLRSSLSSHSILSEKCSAAKQQQQGTRAGVWRTPFSQLPTPTPSTQPIRIDIPVSRSAGAQSNPPLTTFQQSASLLALKKSQTLKVNGHGAQTQCPQSQLYENYACPIPATKKLPQPTLAPPQPQLRAQRGQTAKPQVSITPTKHVSFHEPPTQAKPKPRDPQELSDPWRREAQEKLEKQRGLRAVELLEQEVQELQAKGGRTAEENSRLRKLSLEWQFQKRLQEIQQRGEDEDEDEDEDLDMMVTIQQMDNRIQNKKSSEGKVSSELKEQSRISIQNEEKAGKGPPSGQSRDNMASKENQEDRAKRTPAPEKLTFKERQRLFSVESSA